MPEKITEIKESLLEIFFPSLCVSCEKYISSGFICQKCFALIELNKTLFCPICQARLPENKKICHKQSAYLLGPAANYDNPAIQNLIHYFKYKGLKDISHILGGLMINYINYLNIKNSKYLIIPIPLHRIKERKRGFNQSELLAKIISEKFGFEISENLKRIKNNKPQVEMKGIEKRKINIAGCFSLENPEEIKNKNVIILDDVFTSGATIEEAARILKNAGAKKILALVIARA